jgi:response regulator RpfG family c-di-GMP phosphodiesterase
LERLGAVAQSPSLGGALAAARELLGMGLSYVTRHTDGEQVFLHIDGDAESFGVGVGTRLPLEETYCQRILDGRLPALMPDLAAVPAAQAMGVTAGAGVGAYISVPVRGVDGSLTGTLCCANHAAQPDLCERDLQFLHVLARVIGDQLERERIALEQRRVQTENAGVRALLAAVEARDSYTASHSRSVVSLAAQVARGLGCDERTTHEVELVALLHDIGKLTIPDAILSHHGPLDESQWEVMRTHSAAGAAIVSQIPELTALAPAIRAEHERWDGAGYPDGLTGEQIPVASRITLVCDAFHAMTSDRPYRRALALGAACAELREHAGTQFCPRATAALLDILEAA